MIYRLKILVSSLLILGSVMAYGQAPVITHVDKYKGGTGQRITIAGNNFGASAADLAVYFGASKAAIQSVSSQLIEVVVPAGATFENISVTNVSTGLTGFSSDQFLLSYGGEHPFLAANLTLPQQDIAAEPGLYDLCLCDLDGDNLNDIASSASTSDIAPAPNGLSVFRNTSTPGGPIAFAPKITLLLAIRSLHIRCGDLNGDGLKDLVLSEGGTGTRIFILKNTSTLGNISFAAPSNINLTGKSPKRIEISDLDLDGKPELIITDQKSGNNNVLVLPNTSNLATISFSAAQTITVPGATSTDGLAVQDLNGDELPEIVIDQFLTANSNVFIIENKSTPGNFRLTNIITLTLTGTPVNLRVGDFDGDGKPDIAATRLLAGGISVFLNESTSTEIKFSTANNVVTDAAPWGIDLGDLDGDGKIDAVVASLRGATAIPKSITILNNSSTPGNVLFQAQIIATTFVNRHVGLGDLDGDGKPDIAFTSVDDSGFPASKISILRNKSCIVPKVSPAGPLVVCSSFPQQLKASVSAGASYQWKEDGTDIPLATNSNFTPVLPGQSAYSVAITSDGCTKTSLAVDVTIIAAGSAASPTMTNNSPVCLDGTMTLSASSAGATGYDWTGPAGYIASDPSGNATRSNFQVEFAGRYDVNVKVGVGVNECVAATGSVVVEMISLPTFRIDYPGNDIICSGSSKILSISPNVPNFTFQWFNQLGPISGETGTALSVNTSGTYHYEATSVLFPPPQCPIVDSESAAMLAVTLPAVAFQAPSEGCKDSPVTFTNQSTLDANAGGNFLWEFGDTSTSTDTSPTHTFTTVQNFSVKLTASYRGNTCPASLTKSININPTPTANITTPGSLFEVCPGDSLKLEVSSTFASYLWSTSETTALIFAKTGGTFSVELTNAVGCKVTPSRAVTLKTAPTIEATATPAQINIGQTSQLEAKGGISYIWEPGESLSDSNIANPIASPAVDTNYKVIGTGSNGCKAEASVEVKVTFDNITNLLSPSNFITPNSDSFNDFWVVGSILSFPQCGVKVYDDKGLKVFESKPYVNEWDGTYNHKQLPNGVYYYFIQCEGEGKPKTGSITLIR